MDLVWQPRWVDQLGAEPILAWEWDRVPLPVGPNREALRNALMAAVGGPQAGVLRYGSNGLQTMGCVGLIQASGTQVEILPKVVRTSDENARRRSRSLVLGLLRSADDFEAIFEMSADTATTDEPPSDVVIRLAIEAIASLLSSGVPRRYVRLSEETSQIRGRIDFARLATRPPGRDHVVPVILRPLRVGNELAGLALSTLNALSHMTVNPTLLARARRCKLLLEGAPTVHLTRSFVESVRLRATEKRWEPLLALSRLIVNGRLPAPVSAGGFGGQGITFKLESLFEGLIRRRVSAELSRPTSSLALASSSPVRLLRDRITGEERLAMRPDFVFRERESGSVGLVADAKWKRLEPERRSLGLSRGDLYQISTYMARYGTKRGLLLYPGLGGEPPIKMMHDYTGGGGASLLIATVDVEGLVDHPRSPRRQASQRDLARLVDLASHGSVAPL